jgi:succinate-semialdehyde dehydrogenase/glutarate-semialdehyde dehydrogenase
MPYQLYIDGAWRDAQGGATRGVMNPATGEVVATAAYGDQADAQLAMDAAGKAFIDWRKRSAHDRARVLSRAADLIRERYREIARVLTQENGKPLGESLAETSGCADWFEWFSEEGKRAYGRMVPSHVEAKRHWVICQPVGVVAAISPWNFPINLMARKLAAALAAGCTAVTRPSSLTPLSSMLLVECLHDAEFPAGAVNLVTGSADRVTETLMSHPACRKLTFTGSTAVGKQLMRRASDRMIKISLELGGHAPLVVFPDVEMTKAVEQTIVGKFRCSGQSCIAPSRVFVHKDIFEEFTGALVCRAKKIVVGNGLCDGIEMGPLVDQKQLSKMEEFVEDAKSKGGHVLTGGQRLKGAEYDRGFYYAPTIIKGINDSMRLMSEEVFGPILPLIPFEDEESVIAAANNTSYGLAGYVLTRDFGAALRMCEALECGVLGLNDTVPTVPHAPFGGWKESGSGREGGSEGLQAYMETKYISIRL